MRRKDVLSVWSGIRPLAKDPSATSTADAVRDHLVISDPCGLVTVTGGKWTTYRLMAQDAVDAAVEAGELKPERGCVTEQLKLLGAETYTPSLFAHLAQVRQLCEQCSHAARMTGLLTRFPTGRAAWRSVHHLFWQTSSTRHIRGCGNGCQ